MGKASRRKNPRLSPGNSSSVRRAIAGPLGTVEHDTPLSSGATIRAGSPVYPVSAADQRRLEQVLEAQEPGLADRLRQGLGPEELTEMAPRIAAAARQAGASPGHYAFNDKDRLHRPTAEELDRFHERLAVATPRDAAGLYQEQGMSLADMNALMEGSRNGVPKAKATAPRRRGNVRSGRTAGVDEVPPAFFGPGGRGGGRGKPPTPELPGPVHSGPGGTSAGDVLEIWAALADAVRHPADPLRQFFRDYVGKAAQAIKDSPSDELARAWGYMFVGFASGDEMLAMLARQLGNAQCVQVTEEMVTEVSRQLAKVYGSPAVDSYSVWIDDTDFPRIDGERVISGFSWLNEPAYFDDPDGTRMAYRALSWCRQEAEFGAADGTRHWPGVRITAWLHYEDQDSFSEPGGGYARVHPYIPLVPAHSIFVPFGQRFALRDPGHEVTPNDVAWWLRVLWSYLEGQVVIEGHVERHARKRAERKLGRSIKQGAVRVVLLRRAYLRDGEADGEGRHIDWQGRWTVDPFVRHRVAPKRIGYDPHQADQDGPGKTCSVCGGETSHVGSYTKGPSWLPFITKKKLYRLAR